MMLDEEAAGNAAATIPPGAAPPRAPMPTEAPDPEMAAERAGAKRSATPQEIKAYETMVKQAVGMLTSPEGAKALLQLSKTSGPEKALAQVVGKVMGGVNDAASAAGVQITETVQYAAVQPVLLLLSTLMARGGLTKDPKALAASAMQLMEGEQGQDVEQGEPAEADNGLVG